MKILKKRFRLMVIYNEDAAYEAIEFLYHAGIWHWFRYSKADKAKDECILLLKCNDFMYEKMKKDYLENIKFSEF